MNRIISVFLCIIISFLFILPVNASAFDVQGTEYAEPGLLPPDIDFSQYDYYFLTVSGTPENPFYRLYLVKENSDTGKLYFSVAKTPTNTRYYCGEYTSFGVSTNYDVQYCSYSCTTGIWSALNSASGITDSYKFVFDGYSDFDTSCKYIIGANCNIYSYSGDLLRAGDYDDLNLFFLGGLRGSSDKTENPTEPIVTTPSGSVSVDLSGVTDLLSNLIENFTTLRSETFNLISELIETVSSFSDAFGTSEDGNIFLHLNVMKNTLVDFFNDVNNKLDEIKTEILNFEKYFSEFTAVNGEIHNIFSAISGINQNIGNLKQSFETKLNEFSSSVRLSIYSNLLTSTDRIVNSINSLSDDILPTLISIDENIDLIKGYVSAIYTDFHNFYLNFPTDFGDIIKSIRSYLSMIYTDFNNFCLNFPTDFDNIIKSINNNVSAIRTDFHNFLVGKLDSLIDDINSSLDSLFKDISLKIDSLINSDLINYVKSIKENVETIPEDIKEVLKYLFIPTTKKPQELMEIIDKHFAFVYQIAEIGEAIFQVNNFDYTIPKYTVKIDSDLFGNFDGVIIDFSVIPYDYIKWFKLLVSGITCYSFILTVRRRLPSIINGESAL